MNLFLAHPFTFEFLERGEKERKKLARNCAVIFLTFSPLIVYIPIKPHNTCT